MYRTQIKNLEEWKYSKNRKPLILNGARQVGKTWLLEEFGKQFKDGFVRIDFDKQKDYKQLFEQSKNPTDILRNIAFAGAKPITKETLLIFDEIQECPEALNSLKYFCEDAPDYFVVAAGSLLGLSLAKGFPVGKVDLLCLEPLSFEEFLNAYGKDNLTEYINSIETINTIPDLFFNQLNSYLRLYLAIGGMPEVVNCWINTENMSETDTLLETINFAYERDFGKHTVFSDIQKISYIWNSIPSQLSRENKKFLYSAAKPGARAREYENALLWLVNAKDLLKVSQVSKPGFPLSAHENLDAFKIYFNDIGLLRRKSNLPANLIIDQSPILSEFKGAITENYVLQQLKAQGFDKTYYWTDNNHEVDFIIQTDNSIIPIECKSGESIKSTSLKYYIEKYKDITPFAIRYSMKNLSYDGKILNIPLCLAGFTKQILT